MKNTRILLVEADEGFANHISSILYRMGITMVVVAPNFKCGWENFQKTPPDICLLDTGIPPNDSDGIEFARQIRKASETVQFIFMTADFTEENYQKAKTVQPVSFMNREVSFLKLKQAIERAIPANYGPGTILPSLAQDSGTSPQMRGNQFFFRIGDVYKAIAVAEVRFFYAENKMTYARIGSRNYPTNVQLKVLENNLSSVFVRCHKKYLVNQAWITSINVREDKVDLKGDLLPIGYAYRKAFFNRLNLLK